MGGGSGEGDECGRRDYLGGKESGGRMAEGDQREGDCMLGEASTGGMEGEWNHGRGKVDHGEGFHESGGIIWKGSSLT